MLLDFTFCSISCTFVWSWPNACKNSVKFQLFLHFPWICTFSSLAYENVSCYVHASLYQDNIIVICNKTENELCRQNSRKNRQMTYCPVEERTAVSTIFAFTLKLPRHIFWMVCWFIIWQPTFFFVLHSFHFPDFTFILRLSLQKCKIRVSQNISARFYIITYLQCEWCSSWNDLMKTLYTSLFCNLQISAVEYYHHSSTELFQVVNVLRYLRYSN
jgi:hypothetical protein